jgi:hypothetical protein
MPTVPRTLSNRLSTIVFYQSVKMDSLSSGFFWDFFGPILKTRKREYHDQIVARQFCLVDQF